VQDVVMTTSQHGITSGTGSSTMAATIAVPSTRLSGNVHLTNLANFGPGNAYDLGSGKAAYFEALSPSGLSLVVVPEPTSIVASLAGLGLIALINRRRSRR
jgi:hypothetical protein